MPDIENVHCLCRESTTSHRKDESIDATDAPKPKSTRNSCYALIVKTALDRQAIARRGKHLEYFTIAWNTLEGLIAVIAGALAGSISLVGFGIDSFIEVTSAAYCFGGWQLTLTFR